MVTTRAEVDNGWLMYRKFVITSGNHFLPSAKLVDRVIFAYEGRRPECAKIARSTNFRTREKCGYRMLLPRE